LYGSAVKALIVADAGGESDGIIGLRAVRSLTSTDVQDYSNKIHLIARAEGGASVSTATAGSIPYFAPGGAATIKIERVIDAADTTAANAAAIATLQLGRFNAIRQGYALTVGADDLVGKTYAASGAATVLRVGDYVYVWDPENEISDTANTVSYRGTTIQPAKLRVQGIQWPLAPRLGVYLVLPTAAQTIIDLSDLYVPESGDATLTVGAQSRAVTVGPVKASTSPYASGGLSTSIVTDAWTSVTPQIDQGATTNIGKTVNYARYKRIGTDIKFTFSMTMTGAGTAGSGVSVSLPATMAVASVPGGSGEVYDVSATTGYAGQWRGSGSGAVVFFYTHGNNGNPWGGSPSIALAAGDIVYGELLYEAATS